MHGLREAQLAAVCGPRGHDRVVQVSRGHAPERRVEVRHLEPKQEHPDIVIGNLAFANIRTFGSQTFES